MQPNAKRQGLWGHGTIRMASGNSGISPHCLDLRALSSRCTLFNGLFQAKSAR